MSTLPASLSLREASLSAALLFSSFERLPRLRLVLLNDDPCINFSFFVKFLG